MANNRRQSVGDLLKSIRLGKGHTQEEAAKATGLGFQNAWWRLEQGKRIPPQHAAAVAAYSDGKITEYDLLHIPAANVPSKVKKKDSEIVVFDHKEVAKLCDDQVTIASLRPVETFSLPFSLEHAQMAFALVVIDDLMLPDFGVGDYVIVDPEGFAKIKDDKLVAALTNKGDVVLRRYRLKRSGYELESSDGKILDSVIHGLILLGPIVKIIKDVRL